MTRLRGVGPRNEMRRRVGVMIGLDLDNEATHAVHEQCRADQIGRDLMHAAGEEGTFEQFAGFGGS